MPRARALVTSDRRRATCRPWRCGSSAATLTIAALVELVDDHRLVEIVGPGGVGKTALALAVGRLVTQPGGVWFVRLESANTSAEVIDATVAALGVAGGEDALVERLKAAPTLLIIDNCEHVLGDAAEWVGAAPRHAFPTVRVLCTSQAPLDIAGSTLFELAPLDVDDAVALFTERSSARRRAPGRRQRRRSQGAVPGAGRPSAGDRAGRARGPARSRSRRSRSVSTIASWC